MKQPEGRAGMTVYKILTYPHVLLRKKSTPVEKFTPSLLKFTSSMTDTMNAHDGIGLAAAQVGILKRILVIDIKAYLENPDVKDWHGNVKLKVEGADTPLKFPLTLVNPVIAKSEGEIDFPYDGCLSFPGVSRGATRRLKWIELYAKNELGKELIIQCDGIMSICLQHEMDHLEGVLFIDQLKEKADDEEVLAEIEDFESDPATRRQMKKLHPVDAQKEKFDFV